ncbi:MAG: hypothetical protein EG826_14750 [Deltaproteobacteria bacterium]|nr:hypothetical protein [Deltaproteobacteria bacterium]
MKKKDEIRLVLILALFFVALGGWLLHLQLHRLSEDPGNYIPFLAGLISVFVTPVLFIFRSTTPVAYLINGMTVILGTVLMVRFTILNPPDVWTVQSFFLATVLPYIVLLWGKFALGKAILEMDLAMGQPDAPVRAGRFFRFPNMGFWIVHVFTLTIVYMLGRVIWK